LSFSLDSNQ